MEKSKYKEALVIVSETIPWPMSKEKEVWFFARREKARDTVQEAITKAEKYDELMKPKKPLYIYKSPQGVLKGQCPTCDTLLYNSLNPKECPNCGCPLDWEEEKK